MNVLAYGPGGDGPGWWILFPITWTLLFWAGVFLVIRTVGRRRGGWGGAGTRSAESVLAERYARGEITEDEYRERLAVLTERS